MIYIPGRNNVWVFVMNFLKDVGVRYKLLIIFLLLFFLVTVFSFYVLGTLVSYETELKSYQAGSGLLSDIHTVRDLVFGALGLVFVGGLIFVFTLSGIIERRMELQKEHTEDDRESLRKSLEEARFLQFQLKTEKDNVDQKIKLQTQQLRDEQSRMDASINSLNMGFIMVDNLFNVIKLNNEAKRILGLTSTTEFDTQNNHLTLNYIQTLLGNSVSLEAETKRCLLEKKDIEIKDVFYKTRYFTLFITPIDNVTNVANPLLEVIGAVILLEDVTEAKVLERSRDEFFSIASHELRTPLTVIRGNTSMIQDFYGEKLQDPELKEMIGDIHNSSIRLITIVNDFLNVSRLEQKRMVFKTESFAIEPFIDEVMKELSSLAQEKQIPFSFQRPQESPTYVLGDRDRAKEVLINLSNNSIKYTDKGSVTLSLDKQPGFVKVLITDTGKGIPDENKSLLFRKFQQASNNILTRDNTRSTGLGLYIAKLMAEGMGGSVTLERSTINVGSVFAFTLPVGTKG